MIRDKAGNCQLHSDQSFRCSFCISSTRSPRRCVACSEAAERAVLKKYIEGDRTYVMDRGYAPFALFNRIVADGVLGDRTVAIGTSGVGENNLFHLRAGQRGRTACAPEESSSYNLPIPERCADRCD